MLKNLLALIPILSALAFTGCVVVDAKGSRPAASGPPPSAAAVQDVPDDPRTIADLRGENAQLRLQLEKLEKDNKAWTDAIYGREGEKRDLKVQRDRLEKDRDYWKKLAEEPD